LSGGERVFGGKKEETPRSQPGILFCKCVWKERIIQNGGGRNGIGKEIDIFNGENYGIVFFAIIKYKIYSDFVRRERGRRRRSVKYFKERT
jgi:hypothetical protein